MCLYLVKWTSLSPDLRLDLRTDLRLGRRSCFKEGRWWIRRVLKEKAGEVNFNQILLHKYIVACTIVAIVLKEKAGEVNFNLI